MIRRLFSTIGKPVLVPLATAMVLGGCALLSTPDPVQTYRFGAGTAQASMTAPMAAPASAGQPVQVALRRINLPEASRGDRLLGVTGTQTAYISGARWISPAETLLDDSLRAQFAARSGRVRLMGGRDVGTAQRILGLEVTTFEVRYDAPGAVPNIVIEARARLTGLPDRSQVEDRRFSIVRPASQNRVGAIVEAFDGAVADFNLQVVDWVEGRP